MSISKRQFDLLQAMGITVWQRRDLSNLNLSQADISNKTLADKSATEATSSAPQQSSNVKSISYDLESLFKLPLFNDVIRCLGVSYADLTVKQNQLDLGIINWQFTDNNRIEFQHNCLKTPDLTTLANSPALKKALWQSIGPLSSL